MQKTIAFYTFGCRLNQSETAVIEHSFAGEPYDVVDYRQSPDLLVVNTCTVTENGDADTRRLVNKMVRMNPQVQIALVGCQAQVQREQLLDLPNVQWVVGNARKMQINEIVAGTAPAAPQQLIVPTIRKESFTVPFVGFDKHHTRANLKIQDGCDFFCTFCEIPYARGRARSREFNDILDEAASLARGGHHELILTGINLGTYAYEHHTFLNVLEALEQLDDLWRIRISSIEPTTIKEEVIQMMAGSDKMCRYLHIPLQAGSDAILAAMQRKYDVQEFRNFIGFVDATVPGACIGTDVIVGFPGETDEQFEETYSLLLDLPIAYFHVFSYSDRGHAKSSRYEHKVPRHIIQERSRRLRELSDRKRRIFNQRHLGRTELVLFENEKNGMWSGLTDTYIRVKVRSGEVLRNRLLPVQLESIQNQSMTGRLV